MRRHFFINGRFLNQRVTGVQRYGRETLRALDELLEEHADPHEVWTLLIPTGTKAPALKQIEVRAVGGFDGHLWEQVELPWFSRSGLLIGFGFTGPLVKAHQIITIHDAAVVRMPGAYGWKFRAWYRLIVAVVAARAPWVCVVSEFSAGEATACFGIPRERIRVMTEGWQHLHRVPSDERLVDRYRLREKPFALVVSSPTPNKNFGLVGRALELLGSQAPCCVAVGALNTSVFQQAADETTMLSVGYVTDGELRALYEHATCFIFPSFYEGFGIPALEAMASGCAVLASTAPALAELCGDAALYFAPTDPAALATHLRTLFADPARREALYIKGAARITRFDWRRTAVLLLSSVRSPQGFGSGYPS